jgi:hypothetical protein
MPRNQSRQAAERPIARRVAVTIVHRLEAVEVEKEKGRRRAVALHIGERPLECALEAAPVEEAGERILVDARLELRDARACLRQLLLQQIELGREPHW